MKEITTERGFQLVKALSYSEKNVFKRLVQESSAVGAYENAPSEPGSSYLWIGQDHHLNREEVAQLVSYLQNWLKGDRLFHD